MGGGTCSWPQLTWKQTLNRGDWRFPLCLTFSQSIEVAKSTRLKNLWKWKMVGKGKGAQTGKERSGLYIPENKETNMCAGVVTGNDLLL